MCTSFIKTSLRHGSDLLHYSVLWKIKEEEKIANRTYTRRTLTQSSKKGKKIELSVCRICATRFNQLWMAENCNINEFLYCARRRQMEKITGGPTPSIVLHNSSSCAARIFDYTPRNPNEKCGGVLSRAYFRAIIARLFGLRPLALKKTK